MSAYLYDEAIIEDLRRVVGDSRIQIVPVDRVYDIIPRLNDDKLTLPLVSVTRTGWQISADDVNHSAKYEGALSKIHCAEPKFEGLRVQRYQFVPMRIDYTIDVWTRTRRDNDEFIRELYWYYMISPTLDIKVPYDLDFDHNFNIFLRPEITDASDVTQHQLKGEVFRQSFDIYTDDAKLWKSSSREPTTIDIKFEVRSQTLSEAAKDLESASKETKIQ